MAQAQLHVYRSKKQIRSLFAVSSDRSHPVSEPDGATKMYFSEMRFYERALCDFHFNFYPPCPQHLEATREHLMDKLDNLNVNSLRDAIDWIFPEVMKPQYHNQHFFDIPDEHKPVLSQRFQEIFRDFHIHLNRTLRDPHELYAKMMNLAESPLGLNVDCTGLRTGIYEDFAPCRRYFPDFHDIWEAEPLHRCDNKNCTLRSHQIYGFPNKSRPPKDCPKPVPVDQPDCPRCLHRVPVDRARSRLFLKDITDRYQEIRQFIEANKDTLTYEAMKKIVEDKKKERKTRTISTPTECC